MFVVRIVVWGEGVEVANTEQGSFNALSTERLYTCRDAYDPGAGIAPKTIVEITYAPPAIIVTACGVDALIPFASNHGCYSCSLMMKLDAG
ncbi:hypothetical protein GCM10009102_07410 [Sphingomonas insulae]|uniref:Uncharacterized protein n=1 Tax=Sphingomonas insulae TaxID=424800 RepID=A0ABN1HPX0_9SPHN